MVDKLYKLNYPIETPEANAFWDSRHKLNRIKAIIAFSLNLDNANDNLRRAGYYRQYRKRYLEVYKSLVAQPAMQPPKFVLSDMDEYWWDPKPINTGPTVGRDIAVFPKAGDEGKTSPITYDGTTQTISLKVGETFTGDTHRVALDGTSAGAGASCTFTPASSDTVASYAYIGQTLTITAKAVGTVDYTLRSGGAPIAEKILHVVVTEVPPPAPDFTKQPSGNIDGTKVPAAVGKAFFQDGGKLQIVGATTNTPVTYLWKKLESDGVTWTPVPALNPATTADLIFDSASDSEEGSYRLTITNSTGSKDSDVVVAQKVFLYLQNDDASQSQAVADASIWGLTPWGSVGPYSMPRAQVAAHISPISAFIRSVDTPTSNLTGGSAIGVSAVSDNSNVVVITDPTVVTDRTAHIRCAAIGTARVTFSLGDLVDELTVTVNPAP